MKASVNYLQVEGAPALFRDTNSSAIINTDKSGYDAYVQARANALQKNQQIEKQAEEIATLKEDIKIIKQLLVELVSKNG